MENFFIIFHPDLQRLLKSIYDLTRKDRPFNWGQEQQTAFNKIKGRIQKPPYCIYLIAKADFICIQILASMPWAVLCIRYRMESLN